MLSRGTALQIQHGGHNVRCEAHKTFDNDKLWRGTINLYHGDKLHVTLLSCNIDYHSAEEAIAAMQVFVEQIRAADLTTV